MKPLDEWARRIGQAVCPIEHATGEFCAVCLDSGGNIERLLVELLDEHTTSAGEEA